jgi:hypothetical protein
MKIIITESQYRLIFENEDFEDKIFEISKSDYNLAKELAISQGLIIEDIIANQVRKICDELLDGLYKDVEIEDGIIYILMEGEKTYFYDDYLSKIRKQLPRRYNNVKFKFEKEFSANVEYDEDGDEYDVTLMKSLDDGSFFELTGRLSQYSSGRADEWEFEPDYISDDDYYAEMWEVIDEYISDKLTDKLYNEK